MPVINNNEAANRFETQIAGQTAFLTYRRSGDSITFLHTEVPEPFEGQGIGSELARAALDHARSAHLHVISRCPFVSHYIKRNPEYTDLLHR
jgi:predicted GNAT family acetyltransferase